MWSRAVYDLRLTPSQFYALTPRQYHALMQRRERETEHAEFMAAQIAAQVVNFSMCHPKDPVRPRDFMPSQAGKEPPKPKRVRITKALQKRITANVREGFALLMQRRPTR